MIDSKNYVEKGNCRGVTQKLVELHHTEKEVKNFLSFMGGQTCVLGPEDQLLYFSCDYERWVEEGMKNQQGRNWD